MSQLVAVQVHELVERGAIAEATAAAQQALPGLAGGARGDMLLALAAARAGAGDALQSLRAALSARRAYHAAEQRGGECDAMVRIATARRIVGDYASAIATLEQAEEIARGLGEAHRLAGVMRHLGVCGSLVGRHQHALSCLSEALALTAEAGSLSERLNTRLSELNARNRQAEALPPAQAQRRSTLEALLHDWQQLIDDARASAHHRVELMAAGNHAITLHQCGRHREAIDGLQALLPRYRERGMRPNEGLCLGELGRCHEALGEAAAARERLLQAVPLLDDAGSADSLLEALECLSRVEETLGNPAAALQALRRVRELERRRSDDAAQLALARRELRIELARQTSQWARHATQDPLTGLANRRALEHWLAERAPGVEAGEPLTVLLLDLDHFKRINDRFGHGVGDQVLRRVAQVVQQCCRAGDLAVRYGGEEFVLALASADAAAAALVADRLRESITAQAWQDVAPELTLTVSIGLAAASETADTEALFTLADRRLYAAKYDGRNRVVSGA